MTHVAAAILKREPMNNAPTTAGEPKPDSICRDLEEISTFLERFARPEDELLNDIMWCAFQAIPRSLQSTEEKLSRTGGDCHFPGLKKLEELKPRVKELSALYQKYEAGKAKLDELTAEIGKTQKAFESSDKFEGGSKGILKRFHAVMKVIHEAKGEEFARFSLFANELASKEVWVRQITEHTLLFRKPEAIGKGVASPLFMFCNALVQRQTEHAREAFMALPAGIRQKFNMQEGSEINFDAMLGVLKREVLPLVLGDLSDKEHFYALMRQLAVNEGVKVAYWDREWGQHHLFGYTKQVENAPQRVLLALQIYETHQLNQSLQTVWKKMLMTSQISDHDNWSICAQLLHSLKESPELIAYLISEKRNGIYEHLPSSVQIHEVVDQLTIRAQASRSLCKLQAEIPICCPIIEKLQAKILEASQTLIVYPHLLTEEQKTRLDCARELLLSIPKKVSQEKYSGEDVNCLIELTLAQLLFDFYATPSHLVTIDREIEEQLVQFVNVEGVFGNRLMDSKVTSSKGLFTFYQCPIQTAARIEVAAKIGASLALPVLCPTLIRHRPLEVGKELKTIAKELSRAMDTLSDPVAYHGLIARLDSLPSGFTDQIKNFLGRWVEGTDGDCIEIGTRYLEETPKSVPHAKQKLKELCEVISAYLESSDFTHANGRYLKDHPTFSGLLFPYFDTLQNASENVKSRAAFPTTFKHLWFLHNLITGSSASSGSLFFSMTDNGTEEFNFIELSNHFSSSAPSFDLLALKDQIADPLLEILIKGKAFEKVREQLRFQVGLTSGPLEESLRRVDLIEAVLREALKENTVITPSMLVAKIFDK